ncbi:hypothetical protein [Cohnella panacarvi]|uniref:hypothetical protein n=1 Tax=Cohnella panacarvi TaxID=400776 RepID=UPI00047D62E2
MMEKKPTASMMMPMAKQAQTGVLPIAAQQPAMISQAAAPMAHKPNKEACLSYMHRYVEVQAADGYCYDGIVEHVDDQWLCLAVPGAVDQMRGFFPGPFYPPFAPFRPRRFNRLVLPLAALTALTLLPYYW